MIGRALAVVVAITLLGSIGPAVASSTGSRSANSIAPSFAPATPPASGLTVRSDHPRLLLTSAIKNQLLVKKNANDPTWVALQARADVLATYSVLPYDYATRTNEPPNTIFYDYQGQGWFDAALPLAMAYQMTGDTKYSNVLLALADEMIAAQTRPGNISPIGLPPIEPDSYYPTRYLGPVLGIIYDWCYDQLGTTRPAQMVALMNAYYDDLRANGYQRNDHSDGNYLPGHLIAAAAMGYASFGDNPRAQELIDYARIRLDGTPSGLVDPTNVPVDTIVQVFEGGYPTAVSRDGGPNLRGAPFRSGFDFQGWAYGTGSFNRLIDYLLMVKSATGEDLLTVHSSWFGEVLRAEKQALFPNHFQIDSSGDWGGIYGAVINRNLPFRLASILAGTADGPAAQHFAYTEIAATSPFTEYPDYIYQSINQPAEWETFYFGDVNRPSAELVLPLYYTGFGPALPQVGATNGAVPYFNQRSDSGTTATWSAINLGAAWYDDHQHANAGHLAIQRGADPLLVDAGGWMGPLGSHGIVGGSSEEDTAAAANTLFFDDFGDFQRNTEVQYLGGQSTWGLDQVIAAEQTNAFSYARSDLSTAYNSGSDQSTQVDRRLDFFYRNFLYLRPTNVFVVYDQVQVKTSTNPRGPYRKELRWHVPDRPTIAGNLAQVSQGASRLDVRTLLPSLPAIAAVDESNNPDQSIIPIVGCSNDPCNSNTWRVEVSDPANPLTVPFLTVLQPGDRAMPTLTASLLTTLDGKMIGALITPASGGGNVILFNNQGGQVPASVTSTSYLYSGPLSATHTLGGLVPGARYAVTYANATVSVVEDAAGTATASPSGVLQFALGPAVSYPPQLYLPMVENGGAGGW